MTLYAGDSTSAIEKHCSFAHSDEVAPYSNIIGDRKTAAHLIGFPRGGKHSLYGFANAVFLFFFFCYRLQNFHPPAAPKSFGHNFSRLILFITIIFTRRRLLCILFSIHIIYYILVERFPKPSDGGRDGGDSRAYHDDPGFYVTRSP